MKWLAPAVLWFMVFYIVTLTVACVFVCVLLFLDDPPQFIAKIGFPALMVVLSIASWFLYPSALESE